MAYVPPAGSTAVLGAIVDLLGAAKALTKKSGATFIGVLPLGAVFFDSHLDIDTDGSPFHTQDPHGQAGTSLHNDDGTPVDSNVVPFIVLPEGFDAPLHISLGDFAVVIRGASVVPAIVADHGPSWKIGEASIAVHRALGNDPVDKQGVFHDSGLEMSDHVLTIVFPGTGTGKMRPLAEINSNGRLQFEGLKLATTMLEIAVSGLRAAGVAP